MSLTLSQTRQLEIEAGKFPSADYQCDNCGKQGSRYGIEAGGNQQDIYLGPDCAKRLSKELGFELKQSMPRY